MEYIKKNVKWLAIILGLIIVVGSLTGVLIYERTKGGNKDLTLNNEEISEMQSALDEAQSKLSDAQQGLTDAADKESLLQNEKSSLENQVSELESKLQVALVSKANKESNINSTKPTEYIPTGKKVAYLTFDDGPSANTPKILAILKEHGVKATFFVINGRYNHYMKNIVDEGHAIALHTYSHDYSNVYSSESAYFADLEKISKVVKDQTGIDSKIIRFPGGSSNAISKNYCKGIMTKLAKSVGEKGYKYYDWNCSVEDAVAGAPIAVSKLMSNLRTSHGNGSKAIVLMHDTNKLSTTVEALPQIISYFKEKGFSFEVINESVPEFHHYKINN